MNNFLKKILPKRLFYRALLIVAVPILVLQLIITIVFFDSLWIKTNKGMTRALINEINTFVEVYDNEKINKDELKNSEKPYHLFILSTRANLENWEADQFLEVNEKNKADFVGFKNNENAVFINEENYKEKFQEYLENVEDTKWRNIAEKGRKFVIDNLNNDKAVESLVELMQRAINERK